MAWAGGNLHVVGDFNRAGGVEVSNAARWVNGRWKPIGDPAEVHVQGVVNSIEFHESNMYIGGDFTIVDESTGLDLATDIARLSGASWSPLAEDIDGTVSEGINGEVFDLQSFGQHLLIGGAFNRAGGVAAASLASWDGQAFSELGGGAYRVLSGGTIILVGNIGSLLRVQDKVLVAGQFNRLDDSAGIISTTGDTATGTETANRARDIAWWDGESWDKRIGSGASKGLNASEFWGLTVGSYNYVDDLAITESGFIAAGCFDSSGTKRIKGLARFSDNGWTGFDFGEGTVDELALPDNYPCLSAVFTDGDAIWVGSEVDRIEFKDQVFRGAAKWDGSTWVPLGEGSANGLQRSGERGKFLRVNKITKFRDNIYYAGQFLTAGGVVSNNIARWTGAMWEPLGPADSPGVNGEVHDLAVFDDQLIVVGSFTSAGGLDVPNGLAVWTGESWRSFPDDTLSGTIFDLEVDADKLFALGAFRISQGGQLVRVAYWDGAAWRAVGPEFSFLQLSRISKIAVFGQEIYVAGESTSEEIPVVRWAGDQWEKIGVKLVSGPSNVDPIRGVEGRIRSLVLSRQGLLMGGRFIGIGGKLSTNIAKFVFERSVDLSATVGDGSIRRAASDNDRITNANMAEITVRNLGRHGVIGAELAAEITPLPQELSWSCVASGEGARCPAPEGNGPLPRTVDLVVGTSLTFQIDLAYPDAQVFTEVSVGVDASGLPGIGGTVVDYQSRSVPLSSEGLFKNDFE